MARSRERFRILRELGRGAFGAVVLADDLHLDERVAIKIPHDEDKERALVNEAKLMRKIGALNETHIVSLHDLHELDGQNVLVMEFVGKSLRSLIGSMEDHPHKPLETTRAIEIGWQICKGLHALHGAFGKQGIFHRDLKPENVLLREADGLAKIGDFGISKMLESSGVGSTAIGTLPYMSPELIDPDGAGQRADFRADIYAAGVTLYEMVTGQLPFTPFDTHGDVKPPARLYKEICAGRVESPANVANTDRALSDVVMRAIHRDPRKRYQTADELRRALEAVRDNSSPDAAIAAAWAQANPENQHRGLRDVVARFPTDARGYRNIAWYYNGQARLADAVLALEQGRAKCPPSAELILELAIEYSQIGHAAKALETLEEAKSLGLPPEMRQRVSALLRSWRGRR
jgi:serine/threonine protein kinase